MTADLTERVATLQMKLLAIAGTEDGEIPPENASAVAALVDQRRSVQLPKHDAAIFGSFLKEVRHAHKV